MAVHSRTLRAAGGEIEVGESPSVCLDASAGVVLYALIHLMPWCFSIVHGV